MKPKHILTDVSTTPPLSVTAQDPGGRHAPATREHRRGLVTSAGYVLTAACLAFAWSLKDENLIRAEDGPGYWFGIAGASLMGLLLLYPLRKRVKAMRSLGPVSMWFRVHMLFGVIGPVLIILHSNFRLGSFNGRVALFATLIVAGSGIVGRYIYAKLHHGLYGRKATLQELRLNVESMRNQAEEARGLLAGVTRELTAYEDRLLAATPGLLPAFAHAVAVAPRTSVLRHRLRRQVRQQLRARSATSPVVAQHRRRLQRSTYRYLDLRIAALRKFVQFRAFQTLFSLWHIVHYPLFVILVVAVLVHVLAVHLY